MRRDRFSTVWAALLVASFSAHSRAEAQEPAPTQPTATQPAPTQPAPTQPTATQPAATQPAATQPAATQPAPAQPVDSSAPASTEPPQAGAAVYQVGAQPQSDAEQVKLREAERARLRVLLAKARAQRRSEQDASKAASPAPQPAPQPEQAATRGDAGAAFAIGASLSLPFYDDPGLDLFDEDDVGTQFGVWVSYDVLELREDTFLALELGWAMESTSSDGLFGNVIDTEMTTHALHLGSYARWVPLSFLQPHARIAAGLELLDVQFDVRDEPMVYRADRLLPDATLPFASVGLGFLLRTPTRMLEDRAGRMASLSVGLMVEGGYALRAPLELHLDGPGPGDGDIDLVEGSLGELSRSGPYIRTSIVLRY